MSLDTLEQQETEQQETGQDARLDDLLADIGGLPDALTVGRVFGAAYELDGVTIIPVAKVAGGGGGGRGESTGGDEPGSGFGGGFGMEARPIGVYEVRDGTAVWKPAVDVTRVVRGGQVLAAIGAICLTLVLLVRSR